MTKTINICYAKTHLSRLLSEVQRGNMLVVTKRGKPIARIVPIASERRKPGSAIGQIILAKNFDAPLPKQTLKASGN